jgi:UDP-N-acetylglucosamine 1-carboxyvinyltransferase
MIEALTYITFLGASRGKITINGVAHEHLSYTLDIFAEMGFKSCLYTNSLCVEAGTLKGSDVITAPYPLFPTDLHPQFSSLLCFCENGGSVEERIFPTRFAYVQELRKMGANISLASSKVYIKQSQMAGATLDATDLRAGAALITASLGAEGISEINNVNYIVRGYENIVEKISSIGGKIKYLKGELKNGSNKKVNYW